MPATRTARTRPQNRRSGEDAFAEKAVPDRFQTTIAALLKLARKASSVERAEQFRKRAEDLRKRKPIKPATSVPLLPLHAYTLDAPPGFDITADARKYLQEKAAKGLVLDALRSEAPVYIQLEQQKQERVGRVAIASRPTIRSTAPFASVALVDGEIVVTLTAVALPATLRNPACTQQGGPV